MASTQADAIPPSDRRHTARPRGVLISCLLGAVMLLLFCSRELPNWADQKLPELSDTAKAINDTLDAIDLTAPYDAIHAFMQRLADGKFGGAKIRR
jgi:hypothetical protein